MKKNLLWLLVPAVLMIVFAPGMAQAQQRLSNGGFETWSNGPGGPPDGWVYGTNRIAAVQESNPARVRSGSYSAKVRFDSSGTLQFNTTPIPVVPGQVTYACSLWVWDDYSLPGNSRVRPWFVWSPSGSSGPTTYSVDTAGFKLYVWSDTSRYNSTSLTVQMRCYGGYPTRVDSFWLDDVGVYGPAPNIPPVVGAPVRVPGGIVYAGTDVSVYSNITDSDGTIILDALSYQLNGGGYTSVTHDSIDASGNYWYHIGTNPEGTVVDYYVSATDNGNATTISATDSYTVSAPVNNPPVIGTLNRSLPLKVFYDQEVTVNCTIQDLDGTIATEMLQLDINGGGFNPVAHDSIVGDVYWYTLGVHSTGDVISYYVTATDDDGATTTSPTSIYTVHGTVPIALIEYSSGPGILPNCYPSDSSGTVEQVTGIVVGRYERTASYQKRIMIQDSQNPWSGLYVYNVPTAPQLGDSVVIRGNLTEYFSETEMTMLTSPFYAILSSGHTVTPAVLTCAQFPADSCGYTPESYEGMLIQIQNLTLLSALPSPDVGEFWATDGTGDSCIVSNDLSQAGGPDSCVFEIGHTYTSVTGVGRYSFGRYRIMPRKNYDLYTASGTIAGIVYGPDGITPLDGVTITTHDAGENLVGTNTSALDGTWSLSVAAGTYHEHLVKAGYVDAAINDIVVNPDLTTNVSATMQIAVVNAPPVIGALLRTPSGKIFEEMNVYVHASITDSDGSIVSDNLYVQLNGGGYNAVAHDSIDASSNYWYTLASRVAGTLVEYYIIATDDDNDSSTSPTSSYITHGTVPIATMQYSSNQGTLPNCYPADSLNTVEQFIGTVVGRYGGSASYHKRAFIQDSQNPWSGVYCYGLPDTVQVGDNVTIRATESVYYGETEIISPYLIFNHTHGNPLPTPTELTCAQYSGDSCGFDQRQYQGMLLQINNVTIIDTFPLFGSNRGDFWAVDGTGDSCIIANDMSTGNGADSCVFQVGHTYTWIRGIGRYTYGRYRLDPRDKYDLFTAPGTIAGIVYGPDHVTPLDGVTITTHDASENLVGTNTSALDGTWSLSVDPGTYHEHLSKAAYVDTAIADIVVTQSGTTNVSTSMRLAEVFCTGDNIFNIKFSLDPGVDPDCWPSPYAGQVKSVCGIITAVRQATYNNYYIQDQGNTAWGAVYGYDYSLPSGEIILPHLGDYVQVTSKVSEYNGWTELDSLVEYTVISTNQSLPSIPVVTVSTFTPGECNYAAEPFESELVRFNNVTVRSATSGGRFWFTDPTTGDSIRMDDDLWIGGTDLPSPLPATGMRYDYLIGVIRWEGRNTSGNIRGWILLPRFAADYHQLIIPEPNIAGVWPIDRTSLAVSFDRAMDVASISNPANYSTYLGLSITGATPSGNRKVFLTTGIQADDVVDSLIATGLCDSLGNCMSTPHGKRFHSGITSISVLQTPNAGGDSTIWIGDLFTIKAVITSDSSTSQPSNIYGSDQSGPPYRGIHMYVGGVPGYRPFIGDSIIVSGIAAEYFQETELSDVSLYGNMQVVGSGPAPTPFQVTTSALLAHGEYYESDLVTVCDSFVVTSLSSGDNYGFVIHSITAPAESLIVDKNGLWTRYTYAPVVGDTIRGITGIYKFDRSKFRISPRQNYDFNTFDTWCAAQPMGTIAGVVFEHDGVTPLEGVNIVTADADDNVVGTSTSGADGTWTLDVAPGGYHEHLTKDGFVPKYVGGINVTDGGTTNVSAIMRQYGTIIGLVTDGTNPLADVTIITLDPDENPVGVSTSSPQGTWTLVVEPGTYHERLTKTGYQDATIDFILVTDGANSEVSAVMSPLSVPCEYVVGDVNGNGVRNGLDVVYGVTYFKGGPPPPYSCECTLGNTWFVSGDANASCNFNGLDISYLVSYFKGGPAPIPCPDCPPAVMLIPGKVSPTTGQQPAGASSQDQ